MKKTLLATALIGIMGATLVSAATENAAVDARVESMKSEFSLNDQQASRISKILTRAATPEADKEAQKTARMEERLDKRLAHMKEKLELTDAQVAKLKTSMTEQRADMKALREQGKANMTAILTPEQATKFEAMKGDRKGGKHHRGGRGGHKKGGHGGSCDKN
uniref:Zinc resistance-associated protein n=1 Tax=uncultured Thiotrichaceae bacterium TaxID=298394 RepID=A0A6S6SGD1_9GAMM|nr:MAG: Unknown protein [uncultured Thiotrichaceae bacterium]